MKFLSSLVIAFCIFVQEWNASSSEINGRISAANYPELLHLLKDTFALHAVSEDGHQIEPITVLLDGSFTGTWPYQSRPLLSWSRLRDINGTYILWPLVHPSSPSTYTFELTTVNNVKETLKAQILGKIDAGQFNAADDILTTFWQVTNAAGTPSVSTLADAKTLQLSVIQEMCDHARQRCSRVGLRSMTDEDLGKCHQWYRTLVDITSSVQFPDAAKNQIRAINELIDFGTRTYFVGGSSFWPDDSEQHSGNHLFRNPLFAGWLADDVDLVSTVITANDTVVSTIQRIASSNNRTTAYWQPEQKAAFKNSSSLLVPYSPSLNLNAFQSLCSGLGRLNWGLIKQAKSNSSIFRNQHNDGT